MLKLILIESFTVHAGQLNDLMESKAGKTSGSKSLFYEAPLGRLPKWWPQEVQICCFLQLNLSSFQKNETNTMETL